LPHVPALSWASSPGAASYEYCIDTINNNNCDTFWFPVSATTALVGGLAPGTTYWWQVRARTGSNFTEANNNAWWSFSTTATHVTVAAASNGASAFASLIFGSGYGPDGAINGDRRGVNWGNGGGWTDGTPAAYPDWLEVDFAGNQTINEIDVF